MNNYIITDITGGRLVLAPEAAENLKNFKPAGCPFLNYTMLDLLMDLIKAYSWKLENNKKYSITHFLELTNDIKAVTYKAGFKALLKEV